MTEQPIRDFRRRQRSVRCGRLFLLRSGCRPGPSFLEGRPVEIVLLAPETPRSGPAVSSPHFRPQEGGSFLRRSYP